MQALIKGPPTRKQPLWMRVIAEAATAGLLVAAFLVALGIALGFIEAPAIFGPSDAILQGSLVIGLSIIAAALLQVVLEIVLSEGEI